MLENIVSFNSASYWKYIFFSIHLLNQDKEVLIDQ
jgi:hypothetical protein